MNVCSVEGCEEKHQAKGLCNSHYFQQLYRNNPEKYKKKWNEYYKKNREKILEKTRVRDKLRKEMWEQMTPEEQFEEAWKYSKDIMEDVTNE